MIMKRLVETPILQLPDYILIMEYSLRILLRLALKEITFANVEASVIKIIFLLPLLT